VIYITRDIEMKFQDRKTSSSVTIRIYKKGNFMKTRQNLVKENL